MEVYLSDWFDYKRNEVPVCARVIEGIQWGKDEIVFIKKTRDTWLRDFMPVKTKSGKYIAFAYKPIYLEGYPDLCTNFQKNIALQLAIDDITYSEIRLDGGNVIFSPSKNTAIISDRIFLENPKYEKSSLVRQLEKLLEARVIIIPSLPSDFTGHADGMVRFVDETRVIGNRTKFKNGLEQRIKNILQLHGLDVIEFPYFSQKRFGIFNAVGCYMNFLETEKNLYLPVFHHSMDDEAINFAKKLYTKNVIPIEICHIAIDGGGLNCISWTK